MTLLHCFTNQKRSCKVLNRDIRWLKRCMKNRERRQSGESCAKLFWSLLSCLESEHETFPLDSCLSVWKVLLSVCPNVINQFKDTQRAKAEQSRPAREGRREAAAFTVSHESLQPTVLDLCHASSLLLSFFPSHSVFLSVPGQAHWGGQPTSSLHMAPPPKTRNTVGPVGNDQRRVGGRRWEGGGETEEDGINISSPWR